MGSNEKTFSLLKQTLTKAVDNLSTSYQGTSLTDIFITVDKESGEMAIFDDEENNVAKIVIYDWINNEKLSDIKLATLLRSVVEDLDDNNIFTSLDVYFPFSISFTDENMVVIDELLRINDDSIVEINDDLLAKFDKDFDDFLDKLLKE